MADNKLLIRGYNELIADLRALPTALTADAQKIVDLAAINGAQAIVQQYPNGPTGNLKAGVGYRLGARGKGIAAAKIISAALHVHLYEYPKGNVRKTSGKSTTRYKRPKATGVMPAHEVTVPTIIRYRDQMVDRLRVMVESHGLKVTTG